MAYELIVNSNKGEILIALLQDKKLVELHKEKSNNQFSVGDIYLGKVSRVMKGLNAAFVDVGYEKDAFCVWDWMCSLDPESTLQWGYPSYPSWKGLSLCYWSQTL